LSFCYNIIMILAVDYGKKWVGVAIAFGSLIENKGFNSCPPIAMPYKILTNKNNSILLKTLKEIIGKEKIEKIVIGRPLGLSGMVTEQTKVIDRFIETLKREINVPVIGFDERLTSQEAKRLSGEDKNEHAIAATIILQDYLDRLDNLISNP